MPRLLTKNGRDFFEVASLLQKSLRRGDPVMAARALNELHPRYTNYCWNRLMTVSAEDCHGVITVEIVALYDAWQHVNRTVPGKTKGRVFLSKAIVLLAQAKHSRDADELMILVSDRMPDDVFDRAVADVEIEVDLADSTWDGKIPSWVYDVHTRRGKTRGATKQEFLRDEHDALTDPVTMFANADAMIDSGVRWVTPQLAWDETPVEEPEPQPWSQPELPAW